MTTDIFHIVRMMTSVPSPQGVWRQEMARHVNKWSPLDGAHE